MKRLIPLLLLVLSMGAPSAGPVTAGTVKGFMDECKARGPEASADICFSYLRGALDQVAASGSVNCIAQLDGNQTITEVWFRLSDAMKADKPVPMPLGRTVRQYIQLAAPACR